MSSQSSNVFHFQTNTLVSDTAKIVTIQKFELRKIWIIQIFKFRIIRTLEFRRIWIFEFRIIQIFEFRIIRTFEFSNFGKIEFWDFKKYCIFGIFGFRFKKIWMMTLSGSEFGHNFKLQTFFFSISYSKTTQPTLNSKTSRFIMQTYCTVCSALLFPSLLLVRDYEVSCY